MISLIRYDPEHNWVDTTRVIFDILNANTLSLTSIKSCNFFSVSIYDYHINFRTLIFSLDFISTHRFMSYKFHGRNQICLKKQQQSYGIVTELSRCILKYGALYNDGVNKASCFRCKLEVRPLLVTPYYDEFS